MDELAAHTVAGLILGNDGDNRTMHRPIDNPLTTEPQPLHEVLGGESAKLLLKWGVGGGT